MTDSQRRERQKLIAVLRERGATWVEIAETFRLRYGVNARVAFRLAHGWSQQHAAEEWNARWPEQPKTLKNFSYWEQWPAQTGHAPSLDALNRLSQLYMCSVSDLLMDLADHRQDDEASGLVSSGSGGARAHSGDVVLANQADALFLDLLNQRGSYDQDARASQPSPMTEVSLAQRIQEADFDELARVISMWAQQWNPNVSRRSVLTKLSTALAVAAATPLLDMVDADETHRVARFTQDPSQFDEAALRYCEGMVSNLRRQADVLGPRLTLQSTLGHRQLAERLAKLAPKDFRPRALSAYAELTQLMGWLSFNLADYRSTQHYYDEARTVAHDAENTELVTYVLCTMSHLATWQGKPRVGIDHAAAAAIWAEQSGSSAAQGYAADVAVRAYLADGQRTRCESILELEYAQVTAPTDRKPASWWYFYDESFYWCTRTQFALRFGESEAAIFAIDKSLGLVDPANLHERAHRSLFRAEALVQQEHVGEAARLIGEVAGITAINSSGRVEQRIGGLRQSLTPWEQTKPVRELDEALAAYGEISIGNGR